MLLLSPFAISRSAQKVTRKTFLQKLDKWMISSPPYSKYHSIFQIKFLFVWKSLGVQDPLFLLHYENQPCQVVRPRLYGPKLRDTWLWRQESLDSGLLKGKILVRDWIQWGSFRWDTEDLQGQFFNPALLHRVLVSYNAKGSPPQKRDYWSQNVKIEKHFVGDSRAP